MLTTRASATARARASLAASTSAMAVCMDAATIILAAAQALLQSVQRGEVYSGERSSLPPSEQTEETITEESGASHVCWLHYSQLPAWLSGIRETALMAWPACYHLGDPPCHAVLSWAELSTG